MFWWLCKLNLQGFGMKQVIDKFEEKINRKNERLSPFAIVILSVNELILSSLLNVSYIRKDEKSLSKEMGRCCVLG